MADPESIPAWAIMDVVVLLMYPWEAVRCQGNEEPANASHCSCFSCSAESDYVIATCLSPFHPCSVAVRELPALDGVHELDQGLLDNSHGPTLAKLF